MTKAADLTKSGYRQNKSGRGANDTRLPPVFCLLFAYFVIKAVFFSFFFIFVILFQFFSL